MRVSKQEMAKSHKNILNGASRLLRERGIESTSVNDVMAEAGMKNGGFYRHFDSKEALVNEALESAFQELFAFVQSQFEAVEPTQALAGYRSYYLSPAHVEHAGCGCPVAALSGDVARATNDVKASFSAGVNAMVGELAKVLPGSSAERRKRAMREFASLVGAVVIARACEPETKRAVLSACRTAA